MLPKVQTKNKERKRFRSQVTSNQMDQFLSRPIPKIENLNRSLRKSYENDFFKKQKFDQLRELKNKSPDNEEDSLPSNNHSNDSVFTVHNDKRTRKRRERQKKLALLQNNKDCKKEIITTHLQSKRKVKIEVEQTKTKGEQQSKKEEEGQEGQQEESEQSGQSGEDSGSQSQSGSSNNSSSSVSQASDSEEVPSQKEKQIIKESIIDSNIVIANSKPQVEQSPLNPAQESKNEQSIQEEIQQQSQPNIQQQQEPNPSRPINKPMQNKSQVSQQQAIIYTTQPKHKRETFQNKQSKKEYPKINNLESEDQQNKLKEKVQVNKTNIQMKTRSKIKIGLTIDSGQASGSKNNNSDNNPKTRKKQCKQQNEDQSRNSSQSKKQKPIDEDPQPNRKRVNEYQIQSKRKFHNISYCSKVVVESIFMRVPHYFYAYSPREVELFASHGNQNAKLNQNYLISQENQKFFPHGAFRRKKIVEMEEMSEESEDKEQQDEQLQQQNAQQKSANSQQRQRDREKTKKQPADRKQMQNNKIKRVPRELQLLLDSRPHTDRRSRFKSATFQLPTQLQSNKQNENSSNLEKQEVIQIQQSSGQINEIKHQTSHHQQNSAEKVKVKPKKNKKDKRRQNKQE